MTGAAHEQGESVVTAAQWLADEKQPPQPTTPHLRQRFGLSSLEACEAAALAQKFRVCRKAFS